ncbi:MAG: hypothetical protein PHS85_01015, partial [Sulfurovum sp.]|nr:hypothetical protein [Sulfurovum sp.]
ANLERSKAPLHAIVLSGRLFTHANLERSKASKVYTAPVDNSQYLHSPSAKIESSNDSRMTWIIKVVCYNYA